MEAGASTVALSGVVGEVLFAQATKPLSKPPLINIIFNNLHIIFPIDY